MNEFEFLDEKYTRYMFECFGKSTGLNLKGVTLEGTTFLELDGIGESEFCRYIKKCGGEKCIASYRRACAEAGKWTEPYFFRCHAGLVMWAVPIIVEGENLGCLICGQVLLWEMDEYFIEELEEINQDIEDFEFLIEKARKLGVLSPHKSQAVAEMLQVIINYLSKANAQVFLEQKETKEWRNSILTELKENKKNPLKGIFDQSEYLKKEKILLQYIRTGESDKIKNLLPKIFTSLYVLGEYDLEKIRIRTLELMSMISRAMIEGGLDSRLALLESEKYFRKQKELVTPEEMFLVLNKMVTHYIENLFIRSKENHKNLLKEAREYIGDHYQEPIFIRDIALSVGVSESYLSHLFKENFDYTVIDYLMRVRIEAAQELMKARELPLKDIAEKCGFSSQSYFAKVFKKYFGVTPKLYQNKFGEGERK